MGRSGLGELEHLILVAIVRLGEEAYGAAVIAEIERLTTRELSHAATYLALQRLQNKGFISARPAAGETSRGGRAKAVFVVTKEGRARLRASASALFTMWKGLDPSLRGERS